MKYRPGMRVQHSILGSATVQETNQSLHKGLDNTYCFIKLDKAPEGYADVILVDIESLQIYEGGQS